MIVDATTSLPLAGARSDARGVVALRTPLGPAAIATVVQALLDAWRRASLDGLAALLTSDAGPIDAWAGGRAVLTETWRQRLQGHDYGRLVGVELVRSDRIAHWVWDELGAPHSPPTPHAMRPGEVYVRAPFEVTHVAGERLFGDVLVLVLRREDGQLRIAAYGESDADR